VGQLGLVGLGFTIMLGLGFRLVGSRDISDYVCLQNRIKNDIMLPYACLTL